MGVVLFLSHFFPSRVELVAVGADDVVAAVGRGVVDGFVFAHEGDGYGGCEAWGETKRC